MYWSTPDVGDWVRISGKRHLPVTITDRLTSGGLRPGTRGVVVGRAGWSRLDVDFDSGFGTQRATVKSTDLRVVRRRGGVEDFRRRADILCWARLGVAAVLIAPFLIYAVQYVIANHSKDGLLASIASGFVYSVLDVVAAAIANPLQTALYLLLAGALGRFAFR